ncbi:MAG: diphosphomevalonate decarboxylase [Candidatus Roizmanbacteria bacterium]|nr:diphosphomevalonate decarboxylase [Candidatus Roizmanbacteria bacterium]
MKSTALAPSNIAFIKYWGRKDEELRLPENGSISMCLSDLTTTTTVEFDKKYKEDEIIINNVTEPTEGSKAVKHLDRVRKHAGITTKAKVVTKNNFPTGTGLSSSASGFAALTVAASKAAGLNLSEKELSIFARQGSGSACRSIPHGFVEWLDGDTSETSYAYSLYPSDYWNIVDVVAVVSTGRKDISTSEGQKLVGTSPFFPIRKARINEKIKTCKELLAKKDFTRFGELIEAEALELHAIMLTSSPSLIYWTPGTLEIMKLVKKWRTKGLECYFTINTGQDIHLIVQEKDMNRLQKLLQELEYVKNVIINRPADGVHLTNQHLF